MQITKKNLQRFEMESTISKDAYYPSFAVSSQHSISSGRVLDPTTYNFVTSRTIYDMNTSVGGSMMLFSGLGRFHQVKKAELNVRLAELDVERTKNDLALEVTRLFLEILMDKEAIDICENKIGLLERQEQLIAKKVEYQSATQGDLLNVQADLTRAQVERSSAMNELNMDNVAMCELLEIDDWEHFDVAYDDGFVEPRLWSVSDVMAHASGLPQVRQKEVTVEQAKRDVQIASASYWPTVKLNAGYGSTFSNARVKTTGEEYMFYDQLRDNMSSYVTMSLSIPILSAFTVSHTVKARKYAVQSSELELQRTLIALDKEVKQAVVQVNTAYEKYQLLAKEVEKSTEALRQTEAKYDAGATTYYDYQIALGNLFQAQAQRLQARYEYIYRTKIMDSYSGIAL
ncbi:MAG: TolC family protein [Bacteroidales bacterium]|nr:TolC family protein [Bacteroidales bacterium]